jgi:hypothetical protein
MAYFEMLDPGPLREGLPLAAASLGSPHSQHEMEFS